MVEVKTRSEENIEIVSEVEIKRKWEKVVIL